MTEKDWPKILGAFIAAVFLFVLMSYMGVASGFLKITVIALLAVSFFADKFGGAAKMLRRIFGLAAIVVFLLSWWFTRPTAKWAQHRVEENAPRDNFDPKAEKPVALVRFYEQGDGTVVRVGADWRIHPVTGEPLALPGSEEFLRLLTKYEVQKIQDEVKDKPLAAQINKACTYCLGNGCETTHPATILGPGWMEIRSEQYGTTASFKWKLNGEGSWTQAFPESGGTLKWNDANYEKGVLRGVVTDTAHTPGGSWPVVLTCNGQIPIPSS